MTCLKSHSYQVAGLGFEARKAGFRVHVLIPYTTGSPITFEIKKKIISIKQLAQCL